MRFTNLDMDSLRSFMTGVDAGSFARAADRLGRSTSAVSAQLKKLEEQAGVPLMRKSGRGLTLTDGGEALLSYARRILELNDEAVSAVRGVELEGWIRLGLQQDFGETLLPQVLGRFARAHPKVRIEGRIARNNELVDKIASGSLDLALAWDDGSRFATTERIAALPLCWLAAAEGEPVSHAGSGDPLPLVALEAPCVLRAVAVEHLDRQGLSWRLSFVSPSLGGLWAATAAGLGIALRTPVGHPQTIRVLDPVAHGLPQLPSLGLVLHRAEKEPSATAAHLAAIMVQALRETLPRDWLV
ncbi:LysR substrate-binding domain-containing protein [Methylovirgula sp. 4M-Z18]|uniref:LysR substrate-binding domain-containing protein n=1 Tax=Methylovirgula sp. 4M-Z18 TaxID=2293567 RepID=UPI000E2FB733|nr:LysR substrate-binding domain-containing protein [Methylovirgula sp. 4M-Z18]RFB81589.1 LysR family transcriptional regulator [Methylovirgula sp. 4M-Z18]